MESISSEGIALIKRFEGCELKAYAATESEKQRNIWTIGYGNTFYETGARVKEGDVITQYRAEELLRLTLKKFEQTVLRKIKRHLSQNEFDALVSFAYNAGTSYKSGGMWKDYNIWKAVQSKTITRSYWENLAITSGGKVLRGLKRRRKAEADLYFK